MASNAGMPSKYAGTCRKCGQRFPVGTYINWDPATKKAEHFGECPKPDYARSAVEHEKLFEMWVRLGQETARVGEGVKE
jgi:hypothetical protein